MAAIDAGFLCLHCRATRDLLQSSVVTAPASTGNKKTHRVATVGF